MRLKLKAERKKYTMYVEEDNKERIQKAFLCSTSFHRHKRFLLFLLSKLLLLLLAWYGLNCKFMGKCILKDQARERERKVISFSALHQRAYENKPLE
jgi:hypothetical protein